MKKSLHEDAQPAEDRWLKMQQELGEERFRILCGMAFEKDPAKLAEKLGLTPEELKNRVSEATQIAMKHVPFPPRFERG